MIENLPGRRGRGRTAPLVPPDRPVRPALDRHVRPEHVAAALLRRLRPAGVEPLLSRDLESDLTRAALFIYLTESEGLGSAVLLAMAAGVPVIASRTGGLTEVVDHGVTGLQVENEKTSVAEAIRNLISDPGLRKAMGRRAYEVAARRFTLRQMISRTAGVYQAVV